MLGSLNHLWKSDKAAIAPTVALSLFALVASGGIAFDYARLASMDTELQNAADQAALAAATQLNGQTGALTRARAAARMISNRTRFATNRSSTGAWIDPAVTISDAKIVFYVRDNSQPDSLGAATTSDSLARFVSVTVDGRTARYMLTPIVAAFNSGTVEATAVAGLGSSVCKVPPLMMCNPAETGTSTAFDPNSWRGRGIRLVSNGSGGSWGPGVFGYLETNLGPGANVLEQALGANSPPGDCIDAETVTPKPGVNTSVTDAINTRFDIYESGLVGYCSAGNCSPALNTRKDVVRPAIVTTPPGGGGGGQGQGSGGTPPGQAPNCGLTGSNGWELPAVQYAPVSTTDPGSVPTNLGHPRDICHALDPQSCTNGRIGDGVWDRSLYFRVNHAGTDNGVTALEEARAWANTNIGTRATASALSRHDVYLWEIAQARLAARAVGGTGANTLYSYGAPQCGTGVAPGPSQADRRVLTVAVVNCIADASSLNGNSSIRPQDWVEVFMVEPSMARARTSASDVYVEIIRKAQNASNGGNMTVRRDVPYLVR